MKNKKRKHKDRKCADHSGKAFSGRRSKMARSGRGHTPVSTPGQRKKALYFKFMRDERVVMDSRRSAMRFIEGMQAAESLPRLLAELMDSRKPGTRRLEEVLSFLESVEDIATILAPILRCAINSEMNRPLYRELRNKYLYSIFMIPGLSDFLAQAGYLQRKEQCEAGLLCDFFLIISKAYGEPRNAAQMATMAKELRCRGDIATTDALYRILLVDEKAALASFKKQAKTTIDQKTAPACWGADLKPPGERHNNDYLNYRDIQIVPTSEELKCEERPFLPLASGENYHCQDPTQRLLDRNFRLLREDAVNTMRERISQRQGVWRNARIINVDLGSKGRHGSVCFNIQLDSPAMRIVDWGRARSLMQGSVVTFLDEKNEIVRTGIIAIRESEDTGKWMQTLGGPVIGVMFEGNDIFDECVKEMTKNGAVNEKYVNAFVAGNVPEMKQCLARMKVYQMIEASKSFFAYRPILKALQSMEAIPLGKQLVDLQTSAGEKLLYLPDTVRFPSGKNFNSYVCEASATSLNGIVQNTSLDSSQATAVIHALTSPVSLIQGPPGTGKTFIGGLIAQIILQNSSKTILCVCYTNHALDQFLEHMLEFGERSLVRIGGRSKSDKLAGYNLFALARRGNERNTDIGRRIGQVDAQMHKIRERIGKSISSFQKEVGWTSPNGGVEAILRTEYPDIHNFLSLPDQSDSYQLVGSSGKKLKPGDLWRAWKKGNSAPIFLSSLPIGDSENFEEFWSRPPDGRTRFVAEVEQSVLDVMRPDLHDALDELKILVQERHTLRQAKDLETLKHARVIGATTSGAAKYRELLSEISPGVVVVEEAGEVLEAHVLSALTADATGEKVTNQLILIGDHKQLRPKVESYSLSEVSGQGYCLDISLFERLVLGGLQSVTLQVQHRMRPSISNIIRVQTYPDLVDHESVEKYPGIRGIEASVDGIVFIDHRNLEDGATFGGSIVDRSTTKSNTFEVELTIELVRFLLLQGYTPGRIVVLTPYVGQLLLLIRAMKTRLTEVQTYVSEQDMRDLEDIDASSDIVETTGTTTKSVRVSSIDNFQGEESDIVVVSLVRSNSDGNIGFMKEKQRVNVLLSRARHGIILIGNTETLLCRKGGQDTWKSILSILANTNQIREGLPTVCQLHPEDQAIVLRRPKEYRIWRPNGGCQRPCRYRLSCGHVCPQMCHPVDRKHDVTERQCCQPCRRIPPDCPHGHLCTKICNQDCGPCLYRTGPAELPCGHVATDVVCFQTSTSAALAKITCNFSVTVTLETCGHEIQTSCYNARSSKPVCSKLCGKVLGCGHPCVIK